MIKKPIQLKNGASQFHRDFIDGEESLESETRGGDHWKTSFFSRKRLMLLAGRNMFHFTEPRLFNADASAALLNISRCYDLNVFQIVDMIERGADPNVCSDDGNGESALFGVIRSSNLAAVKQMAYAGASLTHLDNTCRTPLMMACESKQTGDRVRIVHFLLQHRKVVSRIEVRDSGGNSALLNAIFHNNVWIVRELLLAGASVLDVGTGCGAGVVTSSAYAVAKWIVASGLEIDVEDYPHYMEEPDHLLYRWFSLQGRYDDPVLLAMQSSWKYSADMVFRMVLRKKKEEERYGIIVPPPRNASLADYSVDTPRHDQPTPAASADVEVINQHRTNSKQKKMELFRRKKKQQELDNWNKTRIKIASKIDGEFSKNIRGQHDQELVEWVKGTLLTTTKSKTTTTAAVTSSSTNARAQADTGSSMSAMSFKQRLAALEGPPRSSTANGTSHNNRPGNQTSSRKEVWMPVPKVTKSVYTNLPGSVPDIVVKPMTLDPVTSNVVHSDGPSNSVVMVPVNANEGGGGLELNTQAVVRVSAVVEGVRMPPSLGFIPRPRTVGGVLGESKDAEMEELRDLFESSIASSSEKGPATSPTGWRMVQNKQRVS